MKSTETIQLETAAESLGLTMRAEFVPFSKSRNAKPNAKVTDMSLNWRVTIVRNGRDVLTTDYGAGIGHCPSYSARITADVADAITAECEHGRKARPGRFPRFGEPILPSLTDVLYGLAFDATAIDCATFEEWADESGYDADSRKGEAIYHACLEIALKLRAALGDDGLRTLREASQGY